MNDEQMQLAMVVLLKSGQPMSPEAMREAAEIICNLQQRLTDTHAGLDKAQELCAQRVSERDEARGQLAQLQAEYHELEMLNRVARDSNDGYVRSIEMADEMHAATRQELEKARRANIELEQHHTGMEAEYMEQIGRIADAFEAYGLVVGHVEEDILVAVQALGKRAETAEEVLLKSVERLCRRLSHYVLDADDRRLVNDIIADVAAVEVGVS